MAKKWIQKAVKRPGRLTNAAAASGVSKLQKANEWSHSSDPSKRAAGNLGKRFIKGTLHGGGVVPESGKYELEVGEMVVPASMKAGMREHGVQPMPKQDVKAYPASGPAEAMGPGHWEVDDLDAKFVAE